MPNDGEVIRLLTEIKDSLERQLEGLDHNMAAGFRSVSDRLDAMAARLDRQGGLLRAGQTNLVRLNDWSEKIDQALAERDKRIDELEARLRRLENGKARQ
jgi:hypothetical protein